MQEAPKVSFHTAGKQQPHNDSHIIINQAYVQYIPPVKQEDFQSSSNSQTIAILLVHGGALTGAMWEATPDRRPGWAILASRPPHSRPVCCIDAVDSGRSQRCPDELRPGQVEHRTAADMWSRFRFGPPGNTNQKPWSDLQFPLEFSDTLPASQSARRRGDEQYEAEAQGLRDAIAEIGECDLVAHSIGCAIAVSALLDTPTRDKVRKLVMVERGPPHTQSLKHLEPVKTLVIWGDHIAGHQQWEGIQAHYAQTKGDVTVWELPKLGIKGNSHFTMHDRNSDHIGNMVLGWLQGS